MSDNIFKQVYDRIVVTEPEPKVNSNDYKQLFAQAIEHGKKQKTAIHTLQKTVAEQTKRLDNWDELGKRFLSSQPIIDDNGRRIDRAILPVLAKQLNPGKKYFGRNPGSGASVFFGTIPEDKVELLTWRHQNALTYKTFFDSIRTVKARTDYRLVRNYDDETLVLTDKGNRQNWACVLAMGDNCTCLSQINKIKGNRAEYEKSVSSKNEQQARALRQLESSEDARAIELVNKLMEPNQILSLVTEPEVIDVPVKMSDETMNKALAHLVSLGLTAEPVAEPVESPIQSYNEWDSSRGDELAYKMAYRAKNILANRGIKHSDLMQSPIPYSDMIAFAISRGITAETISLIS